MFPSSPLTQLIPDRLSELEKRLESMIWQEVPAEITVEASEAQSSHVSFAQAQSRAFAKLDAFPYTWGRMWEQNWFRLSLPEHAFSEGLYLAWHDEAEATLYAEGMPWYGLDAAHTRAPLPETPQTIWVEGIVCRTGIWVRDGIGIGPEGSRLNGASLWRRNEAAWDCYWDLRVLLDLIMQEFRRYMKPQDDADGYARGGGYHQPTFTISPLYRRILIGLDRFADRFDHDGLAAAPMLKELYGSLPAASASLDAVLTGHAHIDLVWLWPERVGEAKAIHTFSTVNRLMESDPELHFGYSQPASYDAVAAREPQLYEAVRKRITEGRWEATGASDVESDTQLACGEALARSFMIGQERFKAIRGERARVMWLPDVFGYSGCLPQILAQTGVTGFYTSKTAWSTVNRMPYSSFRWQGPDGSEVLVHLGQEPGYNGGLHLNHLRTLEECQQQAGVHNEVLVPTGYGDGGGGPTEGMLERAKRLKNLCGMPRCRWGRIEDFFDRMEPIREALPEWKGELYLEYHRGVQTTHGDFKAKFRATERSLQCYESVNAVCCLGPVPEHAWRRLVFCQFHDAVPGSSIREVYDELHRDLDTVIAEADRAIADGLGGDDPCEALFNPLPVARKFLCDGRLYETAPLSAIARKEGRAATPVAASPGSLDNGRVHAQFSAGGEIARLEIDGVPVAMTDRMNQLWVYPDHPHCFPAWEIDRGTVGNGKRVDMEVAADAPVVEVLPGYSTVSFERRITDTSSVRITYKLEAESDVLHIEYAIDWQDRDTLLKAVFPTAYNGRMARFGAPFGSVLRPQQPGEPRAEAMFEVPASRWAAVADDGETEGFAVITEAKYGFSARSGTLGLSLLRSAPVTDHEKNQALRTLSSGESHSDMGHSRIRIALSRYGLGLPREAQPAALAESLYQTPIPSKEVLANPWGFALEGGDSLLPVWVQPLEEGCCVIRCAETLGQRGIAGLRLHENVSAEVVNLSGEVMTGVRIENGEIPFKPYQIFGLKLKA